ncbi:hypothetical protein C0J08_14565 [Marinomonas sp. CT5]|uniref:hypothetical protein n=1 Tax=Marinomonas sp. CT5 TaxID=2066133 RepID=UPI001BAF635D|nr:hypothetical protein [Marinomonas sp. CT5]QUX96545.1 hypothetical protein C0J08_14565 [Marinomonas sp. CT5]
MKEKTYEPSTRKVTSKSIEMKVEIREIYEVELDFALGADKIKKYSEKPKRRKRKWLKRSCILEALLGGAISTVIAIVLQYFY